MALLDAFSVVAHADWAARQRGRQVAVAVRDPDGRVAISAPHEAGGSGDIREVLRIPGSHRWIAGFDFPIGLPAQYARASGLETFRQALDQFGAGEWLGFYDVAEEPADIGLHRPFYPMRPGGKEQIHLFDRLGLRRDQLLRRCECLSRGQMLFWTLGPNQVGRAAIHGWQSLLAPQADEVALWPFDGRLEELAAQRRPVVVETFPRIARRSMFDTDVTKARAAHPATARNLRDEIERRGYRTTDELSRELEAGLEPPADDRLDALVGLLLMLDVLEGRVADGCPFDDLDVTTVEGWMLSLTADGEPTPRPKPPRTVAADICVPAMDREQAARVLGMFKQRGEVEKLESAGPSAATACLDRARERLSAAQLMVDASLHEAAFTRAYDAYRIAAESIVLALGYRVPAVAGAHRITVDIALAASGGGTEAFATPTAERFRAGRHEAEYFDPDRPADKSAADAAWAVDTAAAAVETVNSLLG